MPAYWSFRTTCNTETRTREILVHLNALQMAKNCSEMHSI